MVQKLTQKWSLITMLEPAAEGYEFFWKDYPLHVTLASVFSFDWSQENLRFLENIALSQAPVHTAAQEEGHWGDKGQYHCMLLQKNSELLDLHQKFHNFLVQNGAVFNEPQFEGEGYVPHSTIQKHARLHTGDAVELGSVTILDMFPGDDGYQRRIGKTFQFSDS